MLGDVADELTVATGYRDEAKLIGLGDVVRKTLSACLGLVRGERAEGTGSYYNSSLYAQQVYIYNAGC